MPGFIEFGLNHLLGALGLIGILATMVGHFIFGFGKSKTQRGQDAIRELEALVRAQGGKIEILEKGLNGCQAEHAKCEVKVNEITAFNLRLQAREQQYQRTINKLEKKAGLEITDFTDVSHAPEDSTFG